MSTKEIDIHLKEDGELVHLVLHSARMEDGWYRGQLIGEGVDVPESKDGNAYELAKRSAAILIRPSCLASLSEFDPLRKMSLDEFFEIPDFDANLWLNTAYELNPHWNPNGLRIAAAEVEKKIGTLLSGSPKHTRARHPKTATSQPSTT